MGKSGECGETVKLRVTSASIAWWLVFSLQLACSINTFHGHSPQCRISHGKCMRMLHYMLLAGVAWGSNSTMSPRLSEGHYTTVAAQSVAGWPGLTHFAMLIFSIEGHNQSGAAGMHSASGDECQKLIFHFPTGTVQSIAIHGHLFPWHVDRRAP